MNFILGVALSDGVQSMFNPAARQADEIVKLWYLFFVITALVYITVMAVMISSILKSRNKDATDDTPELQPDPIRERKVKKTVVAAVGLTAVLMFVLLVTDSFTERAIYTVRDPNPLVIKLTGSQWWWRVQYMEPVQSNIVTTANELHLPIGKTAEIRLESNDVIHSFWAPNLHGKKDLIPGHSTAIWITPERAGEFRSQCAEYCGHQHAHMRLQIVTEPKEKFVNWLNDQRKSALPPENAEQQHGYDVFMHGPCVMCHTIQGTPARATVGPDLTHVASRKLIAAYSFKNTQKHLSEWIIDPQKFKPGVRMPQNSFDSKDLNSLVRYLESLK